LSTVVIVIKKEKVETIFINMRFKMAVEVTIKGSVASFTPKLTKRRERREKGNAREGVRLVPAPVSLTSKKIRLFSAYPSPCFINVNDLQKY